MVKKTFLRRTWMRFSKLGRRRKKKQTWRRPTGRHNKMRDKKRGYPIVVSIGYKKKDRERNLIKNKTPITIYNLKDLKKANQNNVIIIGKIGNKKKIKLVEEIKKKNIEIVNININKFMKKIKKKTRNENQNKQKAEEKTK